MWHACTTHEKDRRHVPGVELELSSKEGAIEVDLGLEGKRVRPHPL